MQKEVQKEMPKEVKKELQKEVLKEVQKDAQKQEMYERDLNVPDEMKTSLHELKKFPS